MISVLFWLVIIVVLMFGLVVFVGAPYLPTLTPNVQKALDMLGLKPGQTLLELGSGDGRVLLAAAKQGINAVGYELNPLLVVYSRILTWRYRKKVTIHWVNYWLADWPLTDGIYVFLLQKYMSKLDKKIIQKYPGRNVQLVSLAFTIPGKKPVKESGSLYLYTYK